MRDWTCRKRPIDGGGARSRSGSREEEAAAMDASGGEGGQRRTTLRVEPKALQKSSSKRERAGDETGRVCVADEIWSRT